jgi:prepilin-type N-terminal cleavage/methylation domain-containing protein
MILRTHSRRGGFTLLEVLLASALAVVLMAALYVALDVQLRLAEAGRESIEEATLTRAILHRMEMDLSAGIAPVAPALATSGKGSGSAGGGSGSTGSGAGAAGATGGSSAGATGTGAASGSGTGSGSSGAVVDAATTDVIPFTAGVIGSTDQLTIYVAHVAGIGKDIDDTGERPNPADSRRITYWMTDGGLARQELSWLTFQDIQSSTDPYMEQGKEEKDYVIAEEVTRLQFEYWDGQQWQDSWDGRTLNSDGVTLLGPPMAIRVHFWLNVPGENPGETVSKEFRHTIAIRSAPGPAIPAALSGSNGSNGTTGTNGTTGSTTGSSP